MVSSVRSLKFKNEGLTDSQVDEATSDIKQTPVPGKQSKFSRRFNLTGSGLTHLKSFDDEDNNSTPSTACGSSIGDFSTIKKVAHDDSQWIRKPAGLGILGQQISEGQEDPSLLLEKMSSRELSILEDYMGLWTHSVRELLQNLKDTSPESGGMQAEIAYWRDITRVMDAVCAELRLPYVEMTIQLLEGSALDSIKAFCAEKDRVIKGAKEARWNNKHIKRLAKPVSEIESNSCWGPSLSQAVQEVCEGLHKIFEVSNFYRELRIVSFFERLFDSILDKTLSKSVSFTSAFQPTKSQSLILAIDEAKHTFLTFHSHFFLLSPTQTAEETQMSRSFYGKEGIDFLYFQRPQTPAGIEYDLQHIKMGQQTLSNFYQPQKPVETMQLKNEIITSMWQQRVQKLSSRLERTLKALEWLSSLALLTQKFTGYIARPIGNKYALKLFLEKYQNFKFDAFTEVFEKFQEKLSEEAECVENEFLKQLSAESKVEATAQAEVKQETVESESSDDDTFGVGFGVQVNWKVS